MQSADYKRPTFQPPQPSLLPAHSKLLDFQWRFAVTTQQSVVPHTECFIQLKLVLASTLQEGSREVVHLELSMAEFNEFYREMEKINNMLSIIN